MQIMEDGFQLRNTRETLRGFQLPVSKYKVNEKKDHKLSLNY